MGGRGIYTTSGDASDGSPNFSIKLVTSPRDSISKPALRRAIVELFDGPCDIALLYFSGHRFIKNTGGYLVTPDHQRYDEGVSMDDILTLANQSRAHDKVIIFDCCHSGAAGTQASKAVTLLSYRKDYLFYRQVEIQKLQLN